jgi:cysteinyl-tRNA synthetase
LTGDNPFGLRLYDTPTRRKQPFKPMKPGKVGMYICGPTVYSDPHIGNLRTFILGDTIRRWLEYKGYDVFQVMNITDIDDKTIRDSGKEGISLREFTDRYTKIFLDGLDRLNIKRATAYPKATEHVQEMIKFVQGLVDGGYAYIASDGVYFDIDKFPDYGKLSGVDLSAVERTQRTASDEYDKEAVSDFALWKLSTPEELERGIYYEAPWGKGRPGWHIECSALSRRYLGDTFDIHVGGEDLIFPHHENEIAQSEAYTGKKFVRFWMHGGFLKINGRKMSKSLGNYISFEEVLSNYSPETLRYFYLSTHYRKQADYTEVSMMSSENSVRRLDNTLDLIENALRGEDNNLDYGGREAAFLNVVYEHEKNFEEAMDNDLDTHGAIDALHTLSKSINEYIDFGPNKGVLLKASMIYRRLLSVLGLFEKQIKETDKMTEAMIDILTEVREKLRAEKNYNLSDMIREELAKFGVILADTSEGTRWKIEML